MEGGCACGAVRYRLTLPPLFVHCCHCSRCRRETGSAFAVNALIEESALTTLGGEVRPFALPSASGKGQVVFRCAGCGTALWSVYGISRAPILAVRVGTLDEPGLAPPDIHVFAAGKLPWVVLDDAIPAVAGTYRPAAYWPAESLARLARAREP
jgi:hypothetical protein